MSGSLQSSGDRLALLYHLSQTFNSSLNLEEVLNRVMDEVIRVTRAERGFVMLKESTPAGESLIAEEAPAERLVFKVARGMEQTTINAPQFEISRGTVERVAREGRAILTSDAQLDERFNLRQSVMLLGLRSILCVPIVLIDKVLGVIYVDNRLQAGIFTQADLDLLSSIASSAAIAIENARLYQVAVEKGRMERELQMARKVQSSLLPRVIPEIEGWQFAALWRPARQVGGDYYDFIPFPEFASDSGGLAVVIADVTDKGMPAALFMASTRSIVRASSYREATPLEVMTNANRLVYEESENALFVTLFYAHLDPASGAFNYVNAGHNPPLLYQARKQQLVKLPATGMPMGIEIDTKYRQETIWLEPGDSLLLYTDGIIDAIDPAAQEFGLERLEDFFVQRAQESAQVVVNQLEQAVIRFAHPNTPFDDLTVVNIRRL